MEIQQNGTNKREIKQKHAIESWNKFEGNISKLCNEVGIDRKTFYEWLKDKNFSIAIEEQEQMLNDTIKSKLVELALGGNLAAIRFYLEHKHPEFRNVPISLFSSEEEMGIEFISDKLNQ